jgi:hypothetical protein
VELGQVPDETHHRAPFRCGAVHRYLRLASELQHLAEGFVRERLAAAADEDVL